MNHPLRSRRSATSTVAAVTFALFAFLMQPQTNATGCPAGYQRADEALRRLAGDIDASVLGVDVVCVNQNHPESIRELESMASQRLAIRTSPDGVIPAGAISAALDQKRAMVRQGQDAVNAHRWTPVGSGPLESADPGYSAVNTNGFVDLAGRITSFAYAPPTDKYYPDTLFAAKAYGGIWITDSSLSHWVSIGDGLPTQIVGAVAYTPAARGTILALTGDGSFGRYSREGAGAFYSRDGGRHWTQAKGIPDDAFGFKLAVDPTNPRVVYAATGTGLYRSTNAGRSYVNVKLPTGPCAGKSNRVRPCTLANIVTDVIVMAPGGVTEEKGGTVLAAVGWNGGNRENPDGTVQSPNNGLYASDTGNPGTFEKISPVGFVPQNRIGRIELGEVTGTDQDHNFVYAIVQDAILRRNGLPAIDAPGDYNSTCKEVETSLTDAGVPALPVPIPCQPPTVLNGVYVSPDFGHTWTLMADASALMLPGTGSTLAPVQAVIGGYGPGVQAWYNEFIKVDPTLTAPGGIPTRVLFGLEEVWQNVNTNVPAVGPTAFKVIGRYFAGSTCYSGVVTVAGICATDVDGALINETTTHPDQHDAVFIPTSDGGVKIVVGNDGGVYSQHAVAGGEFNNASWGDGSNIGFNTLLPYDAVRAKDGTVWMGLQDNGVAKIVDIRRGGRVVQRGRQIMTNGGDGFFVAVHPENSKVAFSEYVYGAMSATTDGGRTWSGMNPPITNGHFNTPFVQDPLDPYHIMIAGREVVETGSGPGTSADDWAKVLDLGTAQHRGSADADPTPTDPVNQMTAIDMVGPNAYVGFCGTCDVLDVNAPFRNGIATNVGGSKPAKRYTSDRWHFAKAAGLPNRYITAVAMDPKNPKTVYASLGGYLRRWTPPGTIAGSAQRGGHIYVSHDAGESFRNITGNLPNTPVNWVTLRGKQLIAATDIGVFVSEESGCAARCSFQLLGKGLPAAPVFTVRLTHGDPNELIAAAYGRGVWSYRFGPKVEQAKVTTKPLPTPKFLNKLLESFDFEIDDQGWTTKTNNDLMMWQRRVPGSDSSQSFQVSPYVNESSASLISPAITVPARSLIKLQWEQRLDTEPGYDFLSVDWSSDGYVWNKTVSLSGQNEAFPQYSTTSTQFVVPAGKLFIRFRLTSDQLVSSPPYTGVGIDNVVVSR